MLLLLLTQTHLDDGQWSVVADTFNGWSVSTTAPASDWSVSSVAQSAWTVTQDT